MGDEPTEILHGGKNAAVSLSIKVQRRFNGVAHSRVD